LLFCKNHSNFVLFTRTYLSFLVNLKMDLNFNLSIHTNEAVGFASTIDDDSEKEVLVRDQGTSTEKTGQKSDQGSQSLESRSVSV
jgi:hypothetical protein